MLERDALSIVGMIESTWNFRLEPKGRQIWMLSFLHLDADQATRAVAELAKDRTYRPMPKDIIDIIDAETQKGRTESERQRRFGIKRADCQTCRDTGWVTVYHRQVEASSWMKKQGIEPPADAQIEEMAPCPDCKIGRANEESAYGEIGFWQGRDQLANEVRAAAAPETTFTSEPPEWVWVWAFMRANDDFRSLPQQESWETEPDRLDQEQYQEMRVYWQQAGSPHLMHKLPVPLPEV
jgi:hypothetical protein